MDPVTAIEAIKVTASIAKSLMEIEATNTFSRWRQEVSSKLDGIYRNTELILQDLRQLRVDMRDEIKTAFRTEYVSAIEGESLNIAAILSGLQDGQEISKEATERLIRAIDSLRPLLYGSLKYGFSTLPTFLLGYVALVGTMRIARVSHPEFVETLTQLNNRVLRPSLDPTIPGSYTSVLEATRLSVSSLQFNISRKARPTTLGHWVNVLYSAPGGGQEVADIYQMVATISGNIDNPDSFGYSDYEEKKICSEINLLFTPLSINNPQPPLEPAGRMMPNPVLAKKFAEQLALECRDVAKERVEEVRKCAQLEDLVHQAQVLLDSLSEKSKTFLQG